jgi:DNA-directed RNA polymerase specialized sigma24 family protein
MTIVPMTTKTADPFETYRRLVTDPVVKSSLANRIAAKKLPQAIAEEIVGQALQKLWKKREKADCPDTIARVIALGCKMVDDAVVDWLRRAKFERKHFVDGPKAAGKAPDDVDPNDQPNYVDELAPMVANNPEKALVTNQKLAFLRDQRERGTVTDDDMEMMSAVAAGETTYEELAAKRGVPSATLRKRIDRIRDRLNKAWRKHSAIRTTTGLTLLILMLLVLYAMALAGVARQYQPPPPVSPRIVAPRAHHDEAPEPLRAPFDIDHK